MKVRFIVSYDVDTGRETTALTVTKARNGKTALTSLPGLPILTAREDVFDGECILKFDTAELEKGTTEDTALERVDMPCEMFDAVAPALAERALFIHRLRLVYEGRTLAFYWWNIKRERDALVPDCFSADPPEDANAGAPGLSPWQTGVATGWLNMNDGKRKVQAWAVSRVNSTAEVAEVAAASHASEPRPEARPKVTWHVKTTIRIAGKDTEGYLLEDRLNLSKGQTWRETPLGGDALVAMNCNLNRLDEVLQSHPVTVHVLRFIVADGTFVFAWTELIEDRESLGVPRYFVKATEQGGDEEEDAHWGTLHGNDDENIAGPKGTGVEFVKRPHRIEEQGIWQHAQGHPVPPERTPATTKRQRSAARRNGRKGGRKPQEPAKVGAAVQEILRTRRDNHAKGGTLGRLPACRFYLKDNRLLIKAERLAQLVKAAERPRSGKN